jgi:hypothetical protein
MRQIADTRPDQRRLLSYVEQLQRQGMSEREISDTLYQELTENRTPNPTTKQHLADLRTRLFGARSERSSAQKSGPSGH